MNSRRRNREEQVGIKQLPVLSQFSFDNTETTKKIITYVHQAPEWDLFHINPYELAKKLSLEPDQVTQWMLHAVFAGAFDMIWNSLCPYCGASEHQQGSLDQLERDFFCLHCDIELTGELDDKVEVVFQPRKEIRQLAFDAFESEESFHKYYYSSNYQRPKELHSGLPCERLDFWIIKPGQVVTTKLIFEEGQYRFASMSHHWQSKIKVVKGGPSKVDVVLSNVSERLENCLGGLGEVEVTVHNFSSKPAGVMLQKTHFEEAYKLLETVQPTFKRFLTGKEVLNRQYFREHFSVQNLPSDLNFRIGDVTLLFTDLRGSTAMYESVGDINAFRIVRDHFALLTSVVDVNRGAVVKTIGDAVMAAFSDPNDGVKAAVQMTEKIEQFNKQATSEIGLKIGLHKGPALAVNANQALDYFGRTVNIAARVQAQAKAGEIWLSEEVIQCAQSAPILVKAGFSISSELAELRGIEGQVLLSRAVKI